jgi:hypothetical protein
MQYPWGVYLETFLVHTFCHSTLSCSAISVSVIDCAIREEATCILLFNFESMIIMHTIAAIYAVYILRKSKLYAFSSIILLMRLEGARFFAKVISSISDIFPSAMTKNLVSFQILARNSYFSSFSLFPHVSYLLS